MSRVGWGGVGLAALLAQVACQPEARRLLLLDEALTPAVELEATAHPWHRAGYTVEYRRFYPHLTRADLDRYRAVMMLGGRRPTAASDALDVGDLALLTEWTLRGGVVILGYPPEGDGAFDRWLMNRWLAWNGAGITIGDFVLRDSTPSRAPPPATPVLTAGLRGTRFGPFPAGTNDALHVDDEAQTLARAADGAFVHPPGRRPAGRAGAAVAAASRVADGLVIVLSRPALGAIGSGDAPDGGTEAFLIALARWTRRPAEWARIPTAGARAALHLGGGPLPVNPRPPRAAAPAGVTAERLERRGPQVSPAPAAGMPGWLARQGLRALTAAFPALRPSTPGAARVAALDSLTTLLDIGGFNALATDAHVAPLADSGLGLRWEREALRGAWQQVAERLQTTNVRWIPLVRLRELWTPADSAGAERCPLEASLWGRLAAGVRVLVRFGTAHREVVPAIGIAVDESTREWAGLVYCDAAWQAALGVLMRDTTLSRVRQARLAAVPLAARYDSLLEGGLIDAYDSAVARVVRQRAVALRGEASRVRRDLLFAVVLDHSPGDWLTRNLVHGLSTPNLPVLVFSPDPRARALLAPDANVLHLIRLDPAVVLSGEAERLGSTLLREQDGFWLGPAEALLAGPSDSLARRVRRLTKARQAQ